MDARVWVQVSRWSWVGCTVERGSEIAERFWPKSGRKGHSDPGSDKGTLGEYPCFCTALLRLCRVVARDKMHQFLIKIPVYCVWLRRSVTD